MNTDMITDNGGDAGTDMNRVEQHPRWCQGGRHHEGSLMSEHIAALGAVTIGNGFVEVCLMQPPGGDPCVGIVAGEDDEGTAWNLVDLRPFDAFVLHTLLVNAIGAVGVAVAAGEHPWWCWRRNHLPDRPGHGGDAGEVRQVDGDGFVQLSMLLSGDGDREVSILVGEDKAEGDGAWLRMTPGQARELADLVDVAVVLAMAATTG